MKLRKIFAALLCILVFATSTTQVFAASGSYNFSGTDGTLYAVTKSNAPLRDASHDQGKVLAKLQTGQVINVSKSFKTSKGTSWLEVKCFKDGQPTTAYLYSGNASQLYYKKYTGTSGSIVNVCKSLGIDSSFSHRKKIAVANGITNYSGTAAQNTSLVRLAKEGKLICSNITKTIFDSAPVVNNAAYFPRYTGNTSSIVTALKAVGADSSYSYRAKIAAANGITGYSGTAQQNLQMVSLLKNGKLVKPGSSAATTPSQPTTSSKPTQNTTSGGKATLVDANANLSVKNKAKENGIKYASYAGQRSAAAYNTVIDQYFVETNSRYARTSTSTYCNIFASDVMLAMGLEGDYSHWLKNNAPSNSNTKGAYELNANATYNWINKYGSKYGWTKVSAEEAQERANAGYPTIGIWKNPTGKSGHVVVIRPEGTAPDGKTYTYSATKGPVIAQAGASNFNYGNISKGFSKDKMPAIQYWTHA